MFFNENTARKVTAEEIGEWRVKELRDFCKENGIKGYSKLRKAELVAMVTEFVETHETAKSSTNSQLSITPNPLSERFLTEGKVTGMREYVRRKKLAENKEYLRCWRVCLLTLVKSGKSAELEAEIDAVLKNIESCQQRITELETRKPIIESVRVTDLRWSPEAKNLDEANFVAHKQNVSADHLRRQAKSGIYDALAVERAIANSGNGGVVYSAFETELNDELDQRPNDEDGARSLYELYECYVKLDINGDGLLEDALISVVGDEVLRVSENPYGRTPIFSLSPIRDAFKVLANLSLSEIVGEIQMIKTALMRQLLINTVNINNLRWFINPTGVNLKDIQENKQFIRVQGADLRTVVMPFPQQALANWTMPLFEYFEGALEQWTGRTRYNQGTDSSSLNKTATGISLLQQASEQRIDYIVRVFAETGVGEMLRFLVELNQRYIDQPQVIRLKNTMLQISPDDLKGEFDIDVNTEAGVGKRKQNIQNLQFYLSAIAPTGMQLGAITPGEWAKAAQKLLQESGIRNPHDYVLDPEIVKQQFFMQLATAQGQMAVQQGAEQGMNNIQSQGAMNNDGRKRDRATRAG